MEPPALPPPAADALSSLPDALVDDNIFTRLDLRDIVRTSALSRAWQHRWESLPALFLSPRDGIGTPPAIVDSVLNLYAGRIPNFSVRVNSQFEPRAEGWLINLSQRHRHVQSMDLRSNDGFLEIHSSIYSFSHLVTLKLHRCAIPTRTEGFAGFPLLKELELVDAHLSVQDLAAIVAGSPLLDALMLYDVYVNNELEDCVIEAPNLRSLTIISVAVYGWQFGGLPRLDNANIDLDTDMMYEGDFVAFLARVAHARKLTLTPFHPPHFSDDTLRGTLPYKFVNLRSLFLCTHFCESYSILATFFLLRNAPNLEELEITINGAQEEEIDEANTEFQNTQLTNGMGASLQVVTINGISCLSSEMCFIELVLSKATMLRTMSITLDDEFSRSDEDVLNDLKVYRRASPHAQILLQKSTTKGEEMDYQTNSSMHHCPFSRSSLLTVAKTWNMGLRKRKNVESQNLEGQQDSNSTTSTSIKIHLVAVVLTSK